jgi:Mycobacterium 19 kDa lipoprotein antigen
VTVRPVSLHVTGRPVPAAGGAILLATLLGCSVDRAPTEVTTVVFDGQSLTIKGPVTCTTQPDGKLVILATDDTQDTVRVLLRRDHQLVVEKVGLRVGDARGFTDDDSAAWATKVDDAYTVNGQLPPNSGEVVPHQFKIETTCHNEVPAPVSQAPGLGAP